MNAKQLEQTVRTDDDVNLHVCLIGDGPQDVLLVPRPSNSAALRLYHALGFTQLGMRRGYYQAVGGREDAIVLKRRIDA